MNQFPPAPAEDSIVTDLLLVNGRITTRALDQEEHPALLLRGGRVHAAGTADEVRALAAPGAQEIDLGGRRAIPGLIDSHMHFVRAGLTWTRQIDWTGVRSLADGMELIRRAAAERPAGEWIAVFGGWHPGQFHEGVGPTHAQLSEVAPQHPVYVQLLYEQGTLNRAGLDALGFHTADDAPSGGTIEVGGDGAPTGVIRGGGAFGHVMTAVGRPDVEEQIVGLVDLAARLHGLGLVGVIDPGGRGVTPQAYWPLFEAWRRRLLDLRVRLYLTAQEAGREFEQIRQQAEMLQQGFGDDRLRLVGFGELVHLAFADLEGLTPWSISDRDRAELREIIEYCAREGWPVHMHAVIRDTITAALDVWEEVDAVVPLAGKGFSLAHVEPIRESDLERVKRMGVGLAIQDRLVFRAADSARVWGDDVVLDSPPLRRMLDLGIPVGGGTDSTVVTSYDPWLSMWWLITGRSVDGAPPRSEEHRLTRAEALHLYTKGSAWFSHEDHERGSLTPGEFADVVVLSDDLFEVDDDAIRQLRSVLTVVGGRVVHDELTD